MLERPSKLTSYRFDQLADQINQRVKPAEADVERYVGLEHLDPDSLRICRWGDPSEVESTKLRFEPGDIIFGKRRVYQRKVAVADTEGICSAHAMVLRAKPDTVLPEFLPFFMQSDLFMERALSISVGSLSPTINWKALAKEEFLLPPLQEQARLVEAFSASRMLMETLQETVSAADCARSALRNHLFSGGAEQGPVKSTKLGQLPETWNVEPLSAAFELLDNLRIPLKEADRLKRQGQYPYYGASGPIDTIDDFLFDEPTILLAEDGMNLVFRNTPIAIKATGKYWVNNHAHVLRPKTGTDIDFFLEYLNYISLLPYITGTDQKKITKANCENIPLVVPPEHRQREISAIFALFDKKQAAIQQRLEAAKYIHKKLLEEFAS